MGEEFSPPIEGFMGRDCNHPKSIGHLRLLEVSKQVILFASNTNRM